jgi:2-polyprenyl-6-methoxyphenol hydroxylase-like FAD-dependent oxidoreductase
MNTYEVPVLVVGAGPAGLATAATLARHGVECLIAERRSAPPSHPRATLVSTRTMELVRAFGVEEQVLAEAVDVEWLMWCCESLARAGEGIGVEVGLPTAEQASLISPAAPACVAQDHVEGVLRAHLAADPAVDLELGTELVELRARRHGVRCTVRDPTGERRTIDAGYVVAADGAYSATRRAVGIAMHGPDDVLAGVTEVIRAPLWDALGDRRYGLYLVERPEPGGAVFLPAGRGDRWRVGFLTDPSAGRPVTPDPDAAVELIRRGAGMPGLPVEIESLGAFTAGVQLADRFRDGRVFLVGDAAHRVTPRGGTGMNTAFYDGVDLGWKLAWVLRGWADDGLLDTYEDERRPVAEHNAARSADLDGSRRAPGDELRMDLGGRIAHHWVRTGEGVVSTLDLLGPGWTLFTGPDPGGWRAAAEAGPGGPPVTVRTLDAVAARAVGTGQAGAVLARPDGIPVAVLPSAAANQAGALRGAVGVAPAASVDLPGALAA